MKNTIVTVLVLIFVGVGIYFVIQSSPREVADVEVTIVPTIEPIDDEPEIDEPIAVEESENANVVVVGTSVEGREIMAYHYGNNSVSFNPSLGDTEILLVGGTHGGYSWNTSLVAYEAMEYLEANPAVIPFNVRVTVVPVLNPDGLYKVVGTTTNQFTLADVPTSLDIQKSGRFNGNGVDINRNFDCDWKSVGTWRKASVSGGSEVFSEPESMAIKTYIEENNPSVVVIWFSSADGVYSSSCGDDVLPETTKLNEIYSEASGYPSYESFDFYETTGDMANWFAKMNIPAISVLLSTHEDTEWDKNQAGLEALLDHHATSFE